MNFITPELLLISLFIAGFIYWFNAQGVKEIAYRATRAYCQKMDLQMLDDYVALNAFWLKRDAQGRIHIWRAYQFEFTANGNDRYNGKIVMLGRRIEFIQTEPYRMP